MKAGEDAFNVTLHKLHSLQISIIYLFSRDFPLIPRIHDASQVNTNEQEQRKSPRLLLLEGSHGEKLALLLCEASHFVGKLLNIDWLVFLCSH